MKLTILILAGYLAGLSMPAQAAAPLRIGIADSDSAPIVIINGGQLTGGLSRELSEALGKALAVPVQFVVIPRKRVELSISQGSIDMVCNTNPLWYVGADKVRWTQEFYPQIERIISKKTHTRTIDALEQLVGQRIGVIGGYHYSSIEPLWQSMRATRVNQPRLPQLIRALQSGLVDVAINSELEIAAWARANLAAAEHIRMHPMIVSTVPTRCAVSPASRYSVDKLNSALTEMHRNGITKRILKRYEWTNR